MGDVLETCKAVPHKGLIRYGRTKKVKDRPQRHEKKYPPSLERRESFLNLTCANQSRHYEVQGTCVKTMRW